MSTVPSLGETTVQPIHDSRKRGCLFLIRRALTLLILTLVILAVGGAVYQAVATENDKRTYVAPGQRVEVDGHQMHILCTGEGSPTIILEAAGGHFSTTWALVQPQVAQSTRVCAYDRAGYGWSEPRSEARDAKQIATELHNLLTAAEIKPPFVMVGHSVGGIYIREYNAQYPGEVLGMVLVNSTHPDNWTRQGESIETLQMMASVSAGLARIGLMRMFIAAQNFGLPAENNAALKANMSTSQYWDTQHADTESMFTSLEQVSSSGDLGDMPLAVLAAVDYPEGKGRDTELALQKELAALSTNSIYQLIDGAHHITLVTDPVYASLVGDAILQVVEAVRISVPLNAQPKYG